MAEKGSFRSFCRPVRTRWVGVKVSQKVILGVSAVKFGFASCKADLHRSCCKLEKLIVAITDFYLSGCPGRVSLWGQSGHGIHSWAAPE